MALSYHLFTLSTQIRGVPRGIAVRHGRRADRFGVGRQQRVDRAAGLSAFAQEVVERIDGHASYRFRRRDGHATAVTSRLRRHLAESPAQQIFGIIGPANSGKTTLLKCINRTIDFVDSARVAGQGLGRRRGRARDAQRVRAAAARRAWSFRCRSACRCRSTKTWPTRRGGPACTTGTSWTSWSRSACDRPCCGTKSRIACNSLGTKLSGGQQQRLTLARALSHRPEILCLDEFSIAIDPVTTMKIEDVLLELKKEMTIVLVTNLVQQAHRLADHTAFLNDSKLVEVGETEKIFSEPDNQLTYEYVTGGFG